MIAKLAGPVNAGIRLHVVGVSMTNIAITKDAAAFIASRVAAFATDVADERRWLAPYVAQFNALPLYVGWTETIGIRADGEIITWSTEEEFADIQPLDDRTLVSIALVAGSKRYPELQHLLPQRGADAVDCACRDVPFLASGQAFCGTCGGLGWVPRQQGDA